MPDADTMKLVPKRTQVVFKRVVAPKAPDLLAAQLREAILKGEFSEGDTLPPERDLVEQTGLTRGAVRGALSVLAGEGLVETRPGRFGGNIVTLPKQELMANSIGQFIRGRKVSLSTLHETRAALEPVLARLAALRRTDDDLRTLQSLHEDLVASVGNFQKFSLVNIQWHNAIASASGNELLSAVLYGISYGVVVSTTTAEYDTASTRKAVILIHSRINAAIEAGNGDLAELYMRQHIGATHARAASPETVDVPMSDDDGA
jgi:GntR family transcriptional regulator, transcriptional repressor for pyruvate dehydrogenase complex